ncbi:MAG: hypothetical protein ACE5F1_21285 [Planctomycetota bacterium]
MEAEENDENPVPERTEHLVVTVGRVWREARVTCPHRDILRAYRENALKPEQADYLRFHIEEAECPYCQAQLEDLARTDETATTGQLDGFKERLLSSTMTFLRKEKSGG